MNQYFGRIEECSELIQDFYVNNYLKIKNLGYIVPNNLNLHPIFNIINWEFCIYLPVNILGTLDIYKISISTLNNENIKFRLSLVNKNNEIMYLSDGSYYDLNFSNGYFESNKVSNILKELRRLKVYLEFCKYNLNSNLKLRLKSN